MSAILWFVLGAMAGGTVGIFAMCLVQINRLHENEKVRKENTENEKVG